jgi:hypothetical protein
MGKGREGSRRWWGEKGRGDRGAKNRREKRDSSN